MAAKAVGVRERTPVASIGPCSSGKNLLGLIVIMIDSGKLLLFWKELYGVVLSAVIDYEQDVISVRDVVRFLSLGLHACGTSKNSVLRAPCLFIHDCHYRFISFSPPIALPVTRYSVCTRAS